MKCAVAVLSVSLAGCGAADGDAALATSALGAAPATMTSKIAPGPAKKVACDPQLPATACTQRPGLHACTRDARDRAGAWRFALVGPLFGDVEDIPRDKLAAAWTSGAIAASASTRALLAKTLGENATDLTGEPVLDTKHWAIVPAHELAPRWKVITVDGAHPLEAKPDDDALALPLCAPGTGAQVANIDRDKLTTIAMTGTTAPTRMTAVLMEKKGVTYPARDIAPWLANADYVHISNEVSFVPKCDTGDGKHTMEFCAKESYIELLASAHANVIELTGSHLSDYGRSWIDHTLEMYKSRGWIWFGGGHDQLDATAVRTVEHHGNKIGFLGCNKVRTTSHMITNGPDTAACDLDRMEWQIRDLRRRGVVPIVSIQHEEVYRHDPPDELVDDFRRLAAAGAPFVMGSQAHCPHPWEIHHGGYIHYGPGNLFFDQGWSPLWDAAEDKLYIHAGTLLTVGHQYTRIEEGGRPRPMTQAERTEFLARLARTGDRLRGNKPLAPVVDVPETNARPDSFLVGTRQVRVTVAFPEPFDPTQRYPLIVDLRGKAPHGGDHFTVVPRDPDAEQIRAITEFAIAKYPIDPERVTPPLPRKR